MQKIPITTKGIQALRQELERLKTKERPLITKAISEARGHGDLKENAEYHAAKENQGLLEARIRDLEYNLANANVIDIAKLPQSGIVVFGTTVTVVNLNDDTASTYQLVGDEEANVEQGKISINSPIARALVGKKIGDTATATIPSGVLEFEITKIEYIA